MNLLCLTKIVRYLDSKTLLTALKSKSKLSRIALRRIRQTKLKMDLSPAEQLELYCRHNDIIRLAKLIPLLKPHSFFKNVMWNFGLKGACHGGHWNLVNNMIAKGATFWDWGLEAACESAHKDLVNYLIEKRGDLNLGLKGACRGGHQDLVDYLIVIGADNWDWGLHGACQGGHRNLVNYMINKGAADWEMCLYYACQASDSGHWSHGHREIVELMINKGATKCLYCFESIEEHLS